MYLKYERKLFQIKLLKELYQNSKVRITKINLFNILNFSSTNLVQTLVADSNKYLLL